jgi:hypothetical protein
MADLACFLATFAFFAIAIAYTTGCDLLSPVQANPDKAGKP